MTIKSVFESIINTEISGIYLFVLGIFLGLFIIENKEKIEEYFKPKKDFDKQLRRRYIYFPIYFFGWIFAIYLKFTSTEWFWVSFVLSLLISLIVINWVEKKWPTEDTPVRKKK